MSSLPGAPPTGGGADPPAAPPEGAPSETAIGVDAPAVAGPEPAPVPEPGPEPGLVPALAPDPPVVVPPARRPSLRERLRTRLAGPSALPALFRASILLLVESASVGLCLWALRVGPKVVQYGTNNDVTTRGRLFVLGDMFGAAGVAFLAAAVLLFVRRGRGAADLLERITRRCAPLAVVGLLPFLMRWQLWVGRDLDFLVLAGLLALATRAAVLTSLQTQPALGGRLKVWAGRARGWVARALARSSTWLPWVLIGAGVVYYAVFFSYYTIANHHNMRSASLDLGVEDNLLWNVTHGGPFLKSAPVVGPVGTHFGYHSTFFAYFIAPFYLLSSRPETLLIFQSVLVALGAFPLYLFARRHVRAWPAALIALLYLFYPPVHGANLYDFHYIPLGVPFLWLMLWLFESKRDVLGVLVFIIVLSVREDVAGGAAIAGGYLILRGQRPRVGLAMVGAAAATFLALKGYFMPRALHGAQAYVHQYAGLLPAGENSFGAVMKTVIGNPVFTLHSLLEPDKLIYVLQIAVPLCFIPWLRGVGILCSLPGFFFTLLGTQYPPMVQISFQYTAHWTAYLFIALVWNLERAGQVPDGSGPVRRNAWLAAAVVATLVTTHQYGALMQQNTVRGGFGQYVFQTTDGDRIRYAALKEVIKLIPPRAKVVASENVVPHVSQRPDAYTMRTGLWDAEYILGQLPMRGDEMPFVVQALESGQFGVVTIKEPFLLARRGHPTTENAAALARLH